MKHLSIVLAIAAALVFAGCDENDTTSPVSSDVTLTSVSPTQILEGATGTVVAITGTNLGTDKTALAVQFGAVTATSDSIVGNVLYTKVPAGLSISAGSTSSTISIKLTKAGVSVFYTTFKLLNPILGSWVSEAANLAPGFLTPTFKIKKITATFNENKSYTVVSVDSSNTTITYTGTFVPTVSAYTDTLSSSNTKNAKIYAIVLTQATPSAVTSTGIFAATSTGLRYEVIQTTPAIAGFAAPTAAASFGSTSYNSVALGAYWIQKYVKQ